MDLIVFPDDMAKDEKEALAEYKRNGCPGLVGVTEVDVFKWFQLYMSGKTYTEMAKITNKKKNLILYISNKSQWHEKRMQHYNDISENLLGKIQRAKLNGANTVVSIMNSLGKYYGDKFDNFLSMKDNTIIECLDTRLLAQYYKSMETLDKIILSAMDGKGPEKTPAVTVNIAGDAIVEQTGDETLDITKEEGVSKALRALAHMKKASEKENAGEKK